MRLCLDPGHGGRDRGVRINSFDESVFNLIVCQMVASRLCADHWPVDIVFTRADPERTISLTERGAAARGCDLVLSVHANSGSVGEHGPLCFYSQGDHIARGVSEAIVRYTGWHGEYSETLPGGVRIIRPMRSQVFALGDPCAPWQSRAANVVSAYHQSCVLFEADYVSHEPARLRLMSNDGLDRVVESCLAGIGRALFLRGESFV